MVKSPLCFAIIHSPLLYYSRNAKTTSTASFVIANCNHYRKWTIQLYLLHVNGNGVYNALNFGLMSYIVINLAKLSYNFQILLIHYFNTQNFVNSNYLHLKTCSQLNSKAFHRPYVSSNFVKISYNFLQFLLTSPTKSRKKSYNLSYERCVDTMMKSKTLNWIWFCTIMFYKKGKFCTRIT